MAEQGEWKRQRTKQARSAKRRGPLTNALLVLSAVLVRATIGFDCRQLIYIGISCPASSSLNVKGGAKQLQISTFFNNSTTAELKVDIQKL